MNSNVRVLTAPLPERGLQAAETWLWEEGSVVRPLNQRMDISVSLRMPAGRSKSSRRGQAADRTPRSLEKSASLPRRLRYNLSVRESVARKTLVGCIRATPRHGSADFSPLRRCRAEIRRMPATRVAGKSFFSVNAALRGLCRNAPTPAARRGQPHPRQVCSPASEFGFNGDR